MINVEPHELTKVGLRKLEKELKHLKEVAREENIKALQEARSQGDLSENADYDAARDEQAKINARINEIEAILKNYILIQDDNGDTITTGKTVVVKFADSKDKETFDIVGTLEADPLKGKLSNQSPLGKALLGKKAGDNVEYISESGRPFKVKVAKVV